MDPHGTATSTSHPIRIDEGPHLTARQNPFEQSPPQQLQQTHGDQRLQEAVSTAEHTVNVGASILVQLGTQREQLLRARETMDTTDRGLSQSRKLIRTMLARSKTTKLALVTIVAVLIAVIVLLIYARLNHSR